MAHIYDLSQRFSEEGSQNLFEILEDARDELITTFNERQRKGGVEDIQARLNSIFYGSSKTAQGYREAVSQFKADSYEEQLIKAIERFETQAPPSDKRQTFELKTLENSILTTEKWLETTKNRLLSDASNSNELNKKIAEIEMKVKQLRQVLENSQEFKGKYQRYVGPDANDILGTLRYLDSFVKTMNNPNELLPHEAGDIFEQWLAKAAEEFTDKSAEGVIREGFSGTKTGQQPIFRGVGNTGSGIQVSYQMDYDKDSKFAKKSNHAVLNKKEKNMMIQYNPGSAKEGKADVIFTIQGDSSEYRFSAKRWTDGSGDLGETSVNAGITRAGGISVAEAYKLAVLRKQPNYEQLANIAHDYAKAALISDIALGLNQGIQDGGYGYANLLVVDYANENQIVVKDLFLLASELQANKDKALTGYDPGAISSAAMRNYNRVKNDTINASERYLGHMTSSLDKMKVTIYYSVRKT